jgi:hypothetical protein
MLDAFVLNVDSSECAPVCPEVGAHAGCRTACQCEPGSFRARSVASEDKGQRAHPHQQDAAVRHLHSLHSLAVATLAVTRDLLTDSSHAMPRLPPHQTVLLPYVSAPCLVPIACPGGDAGIGGKGEGRGMRHRESCGVR